MFGRGINFFDSFNPMNIKMANITKTTVTTDSEFERSNFKILVITFFLIVKQLDISSMVVVIHFIRDDDLKPCIACV